MGIADSFIPGSEQEGREMKEEWIQGRIIIRLVVTRIQQDWGSRQSLSVEISTSRRTQRLEMWLLTNPAMV